MRAFRIVVVGHGAFAPALLSSAASISGEIRGGAALQLMPDDAPDRFAESLRSTLDDDDARVLVLADLLGGTPYNVASAIARRSARIECVGGVNLAMLLEAALAEGELDDALVERLVAIGRAGIAASPRRDAPRGA